MSVSVSIGGHASRPFPPPMAILWVLLAAVGPSEALAQRTTAELARAPVFTPMTRRPVVLNPLDVARAMQEAYPAELRNAGVGGTVRVFFFIDEDGRVANAVLADSSANAQLDQAALEVARVYRFTPAMNRDVAVPVWIVMPLTFRRTPEGVDAGGEARLVTGASRLQGPPISIQVREAPPPDLGDSPRFTPMTVRPEILNPGEVAAELVRRYPPLLRDAGVGGTVVVNFFIDATGRVQNLVIDRSSGRRELDEAALGVARVYRFAPAMDGAVAVPVWATFPITFRAGPI